MEPSMHTTSCNQSQAGPRRPGRHDRDDESLDEAPQLLEDEPGDVERAGLVEEDEPVEEIDDAEEDASRIFDEEPPGRDDPRE
jgi:hypothetical protein